MGKWPSTFVGTFLIHPPRVTAQTRKGDHFTKINKFEFFLWSNVAPQPTFDYLKRRISKATGVKTGDFQLETRWGAKMPYDAVVSEEYRKLLSNEHLQPHLQTAERLENMPVV